MNEEMNEAAAIVNQQSSVNPSHSSSRTTPFSALDPPTSSSTSTSIMSSPPPRAQVSAQVLGDISTSLLQNHRNSPDTDNSQDQTQPLCDGDTPTSSQEDKHWRESKDARRSVKGFTLERLARHKVTIEEIEILAAGGDTPRGRNIASVAMEILSVLPDEAPYLAELCLQLDTVVSQSTRRAPEVRPQGWIDLAGVIRDKLEGHLQPITFRPDAELLGRVLSIYSNKDISIEMILADLVCQEKDCKSNTRR